MARKQDHFMKTRAELLEVSPKAMVARTRRTLDDCRAKLTGLASAYEEIDNSIEGEHADLMHAFEKFATALNDHLKYMAEVPAY